MKPFTPKQPKDGDCIVHCGHLEANNFHFWLAPKGLHFRRPDGTTGEAQWIVACGGCFHDVGGNPKKLEIKGDGEWLGDKPIIRQR